VSPKHALTCEPAHCCWLLLVDLSGLAAATRCCVFFVKLKSLSHGITEQSDPSLQSVIQHLETIRNATKAISSI